MGQLRRLASLAPDLPVHRLPEVPGPDAAGSALTAALHLEEVELLPGRPAHVHGLVQDHHPSGAQHGARLAQGLEVQGCVPLRGRQEAGAGSPGGEGLELAAIASGGLGQLVHGHSQGELVGAGSPDVTGDAVELGTGLGAAELSEPIPAPSQDRGDAGDGFHVVDQGGLVPETLLGREGRSQARHPPLALQGLDEGRLLAADVGPVAGVHVEGQAGIELLGLDLGDRPFHGLPGDLELSPEVEVDLLGPDEGGGDGQTLQDEVGPSEEDLPVLEGSGLSLVGVEDHVANRIVLRAYGLPFDVGGESGTPPALEPGRLELGQDLVGADLQASGEGGARPVRLAMEVHGQALRVVDLRPDDPLPDTDPPGGPLHAVPVVAVIPEILGPDPGDHPALHQDRRGLVTGSQTGAPLHRQALRLRGGQDLLGAVELTGEPRADPDPGLRIRQEVEEGADPVDLGLRDAGFPGDLSGRPGPETPGLPELLGNSGAALSSFLSAGGLVFVSQAGFQCTSGVSASWEALEPGCRGRGGHLTNHGPAGHRSTSSARVRSPRLSSHSSRSSSDNVLSSEEEL